MTFMVRTVQPVRCFWVTSCRGTLQRPCPSVCLWNSRIVFKWHRFYRGTACNATYGIAVAIMSVCPPVRPKHDWIVTKLNGALQIVWYHTKGQSLCYFDTASFRVKFVLKVTHPSSKNADFDRVLLLSAYTVLTVKESKLERWQLERCTDT